ncbi:alpha/beta fold hydrolase [Glycocaulis sp.]|uniref:alpha/beta fold hydrolase n=1 Tax=Glycocaulis sp. TaxID=1969725 RepID=UPI003D219E9F
MADRERPPSPLAALKGEKLAGPKWFVRTQETACETGQAERLGIALSWKAWGERGAPGLILVHGGTAHKGWWDAIGPFLAAEGYRVVAPDLAGMGDSGWRDVYSMNDHAADVLAAAEAGGAFEAAKPVLAGHSFGGFVTLTAAITLGDRLRAGIILDSPIRPQTEQREGSPPRRGGRVYKDTATALARFRLLPDQPCEHLWLLDHIARGSLKEAEGGVTWKFDPDLWAKLTWERRDPEKAAASLKCPLAFVRGAQSRLMQAETWDYMRGVFTRSPFISVPDAKHHLILDQPLAVASVLQALCEGWAPRA